MSMRDELPGLTGDEYNLAPYTAKLAHDVMARNDERWGYTPSGAETIRLVQATELGAITTLLALKEMGAIGQIDSGEFIRRVEIIRENLGFGIGPTGAPDIDRYTSEQGEQ